MKKRSYWVEEEGNWGMLVNNMDDMEENSEIHWVGSQLPSDVYDPGPSYNTAETYDDDEIYWTWEADGWHGYVPDGMGFWLETDGYGTFWTSEDPLAELSPEETKELDEAYMAYENKARTFLQSRQLQRAKGTSRGFFPLSMMKGTGRKGKSKGKGKKGKSYGSTMSTSTSSSSKPLFAAQGLDGSTMTTSSGHGELYNDDEFGVLHMWRQRAWVQTMPKAFLFYTTTCWKRRKVGSLLGGVNDDFIVGLCWNGEHGGGHRREHGGLWGVGSWSHRDCWFLGSFGSADGDAEQDPWHPGACGGLHWMVWSKAFSVWQWSGAV